MKFASHCLMNHPDLAKDLTEYLKVRSHDPEEAIRHDVIVTIITAGKRLIKMESGRRWSNSGAAGLHFD